MNIEFSALVFVCSLWVFGDATQKGARSPHGWALLSALVFPIGFPYWLFKRRKIEPSTEQKKVSPWVMIILMLVICFWLPVRDYLNDNQPEAAQAAQPAKPIAESSNNQPAKKQVDISFQGAEDGVDRTEQVKNAFLDLAAKCPAAADAVSIVVKYEQGEGTLWRGEKLGWKSELYFNAADASGEHHHFYMRQDGKHELIIDGKQASLDWCGIDAKMKDWYLVTL